MSAPAGDAGRYARALRIAHALLDLPPSERESALGRECAEDAALREEVAWMMRAAQEDTEDGDELAFGNALSVDGAALAVLAPREYRLLHPLGEGGAGLVYLAERTEGDLRRPVALKLLRATAAPRSQRFREEQRILAGLRHDNIAHFIDAGVLASGQPFLAIEYVEGIPFDRWCAGRPLAARIEVFLKVCAAVSHAHAQLVVHRDLKPGNILVTAEGEPKLLDFGIARLLDGDVERTTTAMRALTPVYASPEQVDGGVLGTATDVYSLGAVLYEIASGVRPFDGIVSEMVLLRAVSAGEVTPPSRVARVPADIEAIVLKAMRREPAQRYASVAELADDLRRYLASRPVRARRGSRAYRLRRFVRRHRYGLAATAGVLLLVSAFVGATLRGARHTEEQRARVDRINQFFNSVLAAGDPAEMGRDVTIIEALERAARLVARDLREDPASAALTGLTLAQTFQQIGRYEDSVQAAGSAVEAARRGGDAATEIDARLALGIALWNQGKYDEARRALLEARGLAEESGTALQRGQIANRIGEVEFSAGHPAEARTWQERALGILPETAVKARAYALGDLASVEYREGDDARALELNAQSILLLRRENPRGSIPLATQLGNRGAMLTRLRRYDEAQRVLDESLAMKIELYGESHRIVIDALTKLAQLRMEQKDYDGALRYAARGYTLSKPMRNYVTARAAKKYAVSLALSARDGEALALAREAVALYRERYAPDYDELLDAQSVLGWLEAREGDLEGGLAHARAALDGLKAAKATAGFVGPAQQRVDEIARLASEPGRRVP